MEADGSIAQVVATTELMGAEDVLLGGMHSTCIPPHDIEGIKPNLFVYYKSDQERVMTVDLTTSGEQFVSCLEENGTSNTSEVVFICHGFQGSSEEDYIVEMKKNLINLDDKDLIVVLVDWRGGADLRRIEYGAACDNVDVVGFWVGIYAKALRDKYPDMYIHGIGHSLGAHVMGNAGRSYRSFDRITGLDPAGPFFEQELEFINFSSKRLTPDDGTKMVDVIHTGGKGPLVAIFNHYGTLIPLGTLDFYPNFGGAPDQGLVYPTASENHALCHAYFNWSIKNKEAFRTNLVLDGTPAHNAPIRKTEHTDVTAEMGYYADVTGRHGGTHPRGNYYVKTNEQKPWVTVE